MCKQGTKVVPTQTLKHLNTMKTNKVQNVEQNVETQNVETQNVETQNVELTETQQKAAQILRARLPHLSANALNFEKRTGNFFRATVVTEDDGTERVSRLVVADEDLPAECQPEIAAKRAARLVMDYERQRAKLVRRVDEIKAELSAATIEVAELDGAHEAAETLVSGYELPEREKRETLTAKAAKLETENDRLRALLIAAGIDPDAR